MHFISTLLRYHSKWQHYRIKIRSAGQADKSLHPHHPSTSSLFLHTAGSLAVAWHSLEGTRVTESPNLEQGTNKEVGVTQ
jgi:hypothetical protein